MNIIGVITYFILGKICKYHTYKFRKAFYVVIPQNFGGVSLGMFVVHGEKNYNLKVHEYGHTIQNLMFGIFTPFIIAIPSTTRYWYRKIKYKLGKELTTGYYDIWFEKQANDLGLQATKNKWSWI